MSMLPRNRGLTLVEMIISMIVGLSVIAAVFVIFRHTRLFGQRAQDTMAATQAAALLMTALQDDMANIIPEDDADSTVFTVEDATGSRKELHIKRRHPESPMGFNSWVIDEASQLPDDKQPGVLVRYIAELDQELKIYRITRDQGGQAEADRRKFAGIFAEDVRFTKIVDDNLQLFMRVSMLIYGEEQDMDVLKAKEKSALKPKPVFLSSAYYVGLPSKDHPVLK